MIVGATAGECDGENAAGISDGPNRGGIDGCHFLSGWCNAQIPTNISVGDRAAGDASKVQSPLRRCHCFQCPFDSIPDSTAMLGFVGNSLYYISN